MTGEISVATTQVGLHLVNVKEKRRKVGKNECKVGQKRTEVREREKND